MKNITFLLSILIILLLSACGKSPTNDKKDIQIKSEFNEAIELETIMAVINRETKCFFDGNYECWAGNWSQEAYAMQAWNRSDGTADAAVGWKNINAQGKKWIEEYYKKGENKHHPDFKRGKVKIKFFNDNIAFLYWEQYNANPDKTYWNVSQESRIMERKNGEWKIVNVSSFWHTRPDIPIDSLQL